MHFTRTACALLFALSFSIGAVAQQTRHGAQPSAQTAAPQVITPTEAHRKAQAGEVVLVDIRTPDEWRQTGVPTSAAAITMHQDAAKFVSALDAAAKGDRTRPIALICRTGNRSSHMQAELRKLGYTNVIDVAEGVVGGPKGAGWLKAGLPVKAP